MSDDNEPVTDWVQHWQSRPDGPSKMRSAAHTLIVDATSNLRAGKDDAAEARLEIAADLLVMANDSEAGIFDS